MHDRGDRSPRGEVASGRAGWIPLALLVSVLPGTAAATPTTVFRAPSDAAAPFRAVRVTYDTAFWPGSGRSAAVPVAVGVGGGVLPLERVRLEVGLDLVLPTRDPVVLNAKLGSAEGALFPGSPSCAVGVFEAGVTASTALDVWYLALGKRTVLGSLTAGGYVGSERLLRSSGGASRRAGLIAGVALPPLSVNRPWLDRLEVRWDLLTGANPIGATSGGLALFLSQHACVLTGPVFFFDPYLQPGAAHFLWTVRLEVQAELAGSAPGPPAPGHP